MGPFNYPLNETFTTLISTHHGQCCDFQATETGGFAHQPLWALQDSFPRGVINTVYGEGQQVIGPLMQSGKISCSGIHWQQPSCRHPKAATPETPPPALRPRTEAKNVGIVLEDAELDLAVKECVLGSLSYNGQRCTAIKILFVHKDIIDAFLRKFCEAVGKLKAGMPWDAGVQITPLPEPNKPKYLMELIEDARAKGARVINEGGGKVSHTFISPAVVYPVGAGMRLYSEEQFGPVVPIFSIHGYRGAHELCDSVRLRPASQSIWERR